MNKDKELEEAIKELQEQIEMLNRHIKNYEKNDCKTNIYLQLVKEKQAIKTVLQALENTDKTITDDAEDEITRFKKVILKDYIPKKKIEDKKNKIHDEYINILSEYGNVDTDITFDIPNKNVRKHLDELVLEIMILQELLEEK